jgi:replication factor A1
VTPVQKLQLQSEDYMEQDVEEKTLFDLKQIDPLTDRVKTQLLVIQITIPSHSLHYSSLVILLSITCTFSE